MGWSVGYDEKWQRDIGYGVPSKCDHPGCDKVIDRGLTYVCCDEQPYGGEKGCGLYFCAEHRGHRCKHKNLTPTPDRPEWIVWKLTDPSWAQWRAENLEEVEPLSGPKKEGE